MILPKVFSEIIVIVNGLSIFNTIIYFVSSNYVLQPVINCLLRGRNSCLSFSKMNFFSVRLMVGSDVLFYDLVACGVV